MSPMCTCLSSIVFFINAAATTEIYSLSLHDALPISTEILAEQHANSLQDLFQNQIRIALLTGSVKGKRREKILPFTEPVRRDRKSTRLNSSHVAISYAVFCLKKKK